MDKIRIFEVPNEYFITILFVQTIKMDWSGIIDSGKKKGLRTGLYPH
jgi:hypothetical protein